MMSLDPSPRFTNSSVIDRMRVYRIIFCNRDWAFSQEIPPTNIWYVGVSKLRRANLLAAGKCAMDQLIGMILNRRRPAKMLRIHTNAIPAVVRGLVTWCRRRPINHLAQEAMGINVLPIMPDDGVTRVMDNKRPRQAFHALERPRLLQKGHRFPVWRLRRASPKWISILAHSLVMGAAKAVAKVLVRAPLNRALGAHAIPSGHSGHRRTVPLNTATVHRTESTSMGGLVTIWNLAYGFVSHFDLRERLAWLGLTSALPTPRQPAIYGRIPQNLQGIEP